jgi:hypothetical protein
MGVYPSGDAHFTESVYEPKNGSSLSSSEDEGLDPKKETINRRKPYPHNKRAYRHRNKIERMFCRLKDARRIATRYDKCANNFLSAVLSLLSTSG